MKQRNGVRGRNWKSGKRKDVKMEKWRKIKREQRSEKVKDCEGWKAERKSPPMVLSNLKIERETKRERWKLFLLLSTRNDWKSLRKRERGRVAEVKRHQDIKTKKDCGEKNKGLIQQPLTLSLPLFHKYTQSHKCRFLNLSSLCLAESSTSRVTAPLAGHLRSNNLTSRAKGSKCLARWKRRKKYFFLLSK